MYNFLCWLNLLRSVLWKVSNPWTLPNFGQFGLLRRKFSSQIVFWIRFYIKMILNLQSNVQKCGISLTNYCTSMFEGGKRLELWHHTIPGSWKSSSSTSKSNHLLNSYFFLLLELRLQMLIIGHLVGRET